MNRANGMFLINILLYVLLAGTLASLAGLVTGDGRAFPVFHGLVGSLLALAGLAHAVWHRAWFREGRSKDARSAIKRSMTILTGAATLAAALSGFASRIIGGAGSFHAVTGSIAAAGLLIHGVKRLGWMKAVAWRWMNIAGEDKV